MTEPELLIRSSLDIWGLTAAAAPGGRSGRNLSSRSSRARLPALTLPRLRPSSRLTGVELRLAAEPAVRSTTESPSMSMLPPRLAALDSELGVIQLAIQSSSALLLSVGESVATIQL